MHFASDTLQKAINRIKCEFITPIVLVSLVLLLIWIFLPCYYHKHRSNPKIRKKKRQSYLAAIALTALLSAIIIPVSIGNANDLKQATSDLQNQNFSTYTGEFWIDPSGYSKYSLYDKWRTVTLLENDDNHTYLILYVHSIKDDWSLEPGKHSGTLVYAAESEIVVYIEAQ